MTFIRIKSIRHKTGARYYYAYLVSSYWDKKKQQPRQKILQYIGAVIHLKPVKKEVLYRLFAEKPKCKDCKGKTRLLLLHKVPLSQGGTGDYDNLKLVCANCSAVERDKEGHLVEDLEGFDY